MALYGIYGIKLCARGCGIQKMSMKYEFFVFLPESAQHDVAHCTVTILLLGRFTCETSFLVLN